MSAACAERFTCSAPAAPHSNTNCFRASRRDWEMGSLIDSSSAACHRASWVGGAMNRHILAYRRLQLPAMLVRRPLTRLAPGLALIAAALCLSGCQSTPAPRAQPTPAASGPAAPVAAAAERYRIDADASEVLILIYRDGRMASLGHNHVVAVRQLTGEVVIAADPAHSSWQLDFPVDALSVDEPRLRAAQGEDFQTKVDAVTIAGTRD